MVVYAYNGEPLRPAERLSGAAASCRATRANTCIKWLRRLKLIDQPNMSRDETSKYTDPLPNGTARQFSFVMDAKSIDHVPDVSGAAHRAPAGCRSPGSRGAGADASRAWT